MCMAKANPIGFDRLSLGRGVSRVAFSSFIGRYMNYQHIRSPWLTATVNTAG
jgi:hypothetical protein